MCRTYSTCVLHHPTVLGVLLDEQTIHAYARGCGVLGAGGGGSYRNGLLAARQAIADFGAVEVVTVDQLEDDALIMPCGSVGAPTVAMEKLEGGATESQRLLEAMQERLNGRISALMCLEIGGSNGCIPVAWAAQLGLPLVDADGMGRAFPELTHVAMNLAGIPAAPCVVSDERGNSAVVDAVDARWLERVVRSICVAVGGQAAFAAYPMTARQAGQATVTGSVSRAWTIGELLTTHANPVDGLVCQAGATEVLRGKIVDIDRTTAGGFVRGSATVAGLGRDDGRLLRVEMQNENIIVFEDGAPVCSVPDLITVIDPTNGDAIGTEMLRYGQRVAVLTLPCDPLWRTAAGLSLVSPRAFGYDVDYCHEGALEHA